MRIYLGNTSWRNAEEKAWRIEPKIYKVKLSIRARGIRYDFRVCGSRGAVYNCAIWRTYDGNGYNGICNCLAGQKKMYCYHLASAWREIDYLRQSGAIYPESKLREILKLTV